MAIPTISQVPVSQLVVLSSETQDIATPIMLNPEVMTDKLKSMILIHSNSSHCLLETEVKEGSAIVQSNHDKEAEDSNKKHLLGIRQIWVSSTSRRQSIASSMVDYACKIFITGGLDKCFVAFSQPTSDGLLFAKQYVGANYVLAYT